MPSKTFRQARMMAQAANDADYAASRGLSQEVARQFHEEDKKEGVFVAPDGTVIEPPINPWE